MYCIRNSSKKWYARLFLGASVVVISSMLVDARPAHAGLGSLWSSLSTKAKAAVSLAGITAGGLLAYYGYNHLFVLDAISDRHAPRNVALGEVEDRLYNFGLQHYAFPRDIRDFHVACVVALGNALQDGTLAIDGIQENAAAHNADEELVSPEVAQQLEALRFVVHNFDAIMAKLQAERVALRQDLDILHRYISYSLPGQQTRLGVLCTQALEKIAPSFGSLYASIAQADNNFYFWNAELDARIQEACRTRWTHVLCGKANFGYAARLYWDLRKKIARLDALENALEAHPSMPQLIRNGDAMRKQRKEIAALKSARQVHYVYDDAHDDGAGAAADA